MPSYNARAAGSGLQETRAQRSRARLLAAARELFAAHGYESVPSQEIVVRAGLTRGALYHHFGGKEGLYDAVHEIIHGEIGERMVTASARARGPWKGLVAGCLAFLDACTDPEVQSVVLLDGPAVLGWERWRAVAADHSLGLLKEALLEVMATGSLPQRPVEPLAILLSGGMTEAGMWIARAPRPERARAEAGAALVAILEAMRIPPPSR